MVSIESRPPRSGCIRIIRNPPESALQASRSQQRSLGLPWSWTWHLAVVLLSWSAVPAVVEARKNPLRPPTGTRDDGFFSPLLSLSLSLSLSLPPLSSCHSESKYKIVLNTITLYLFMLILSSAGSVFRL